MNKYLLYFGHCELWFGLNCWVEGNKMNLGDAGDCVYARTMKKRKLTTETMKACAAVNVQLYRFLILALGGDEWLVSCLCHFNPLRKHPLVPTVWEVGWDLLLVWMLQRMQMPFPTGSQTMIYWPSSP
jgi:hypothetical protein